MITSWVVSILLFAQHFLITYYVDQFIDSEEEPLLHHFKEFFKMQTKLLYTQCISFYTIAVIELPPLLILSSKICINHLKSKTWEQNQLRYNKAVIVKVAIFSLGFVGVVLYIQIQLVFLFNAVIYMLIMPLYAMWKLAITAGGLLLCILLITHLQIFFINVCKRRQCLIPLIKLFTIILIGAASSLIMALVYAIHDRIELVHYGEGLNITSATNSIFSSIILAIVGYTFKKVIFQRVIKEMKAGRSEPESLLLIQM